MISKVAAILIFSAASAFPSDSLLPAAAKHPVQGSPEQRRLIAEAVQLNDIRDYEGAIRRFEQVLRENPDDVVAMYELGNTLMAAKDYNRSLKLAMKGAEYDSPLLPDFYSTIASDWDELGDQTKAVSIFEQGMRSFPQNAMLPFNLAVTYEKMTKVDDARHMYETALRNDPGHASSHFRLATLFAANGYEIPAILAYLRFLELAGDTARSQQALQFIVSRLLGGAQPGKGQKEINITVNLPGSSKADEGDFTGPSTMIGIGAALRFTDEGKKLSKPELVLRQHELLFESLATSKELRKDKKKFAAAYYAPYFRELEKAHHTEAFTYSILRQSGWPEVGAWLEKNPDKIKAYKEWAGAHIWLPDSKPKK